MKAVVAAFNQEKALVGAFSVITNLQMELFQALLQRLLPLLHCCCLISSTNSKLVTVPQGLVSPLLVLVQLHNTGLTITLTKQIHAAQMHKNICRQPVKIFKTLKNIFGGQPLTLKVRHSAAMWQPWRCAMVQWLPEACYWAPGAG